MCTKKTKTKNNNKKKKKQEKNKVTETEIFKYLTKFSLLAAPELSVQPVMEKKCENDISVSVVE